MEVFLIAQIMHYKPGSVPLVSGVNHLSSPPIARQIQRFKRQTVVSRSQLSDKITSLQQTGFTFPPMSP